MTGVAGQYPARSRRLPEEPLPAEHPEKLADPPRARQCARHRVAAADVLQVAFLEAAPEPRQVAELGQREHQIQSAVGRYRDDEAVGPAMEDHGRLTPRVCTRKK